MATDAQTLINQVAAQGYEKLSKRELIECLLAAAQVGGGGGTPAYQDMQVAWTPSNLKLGENIGFFSFGDFTDPISAIVFDCPTNCAGFDIESNGQLVSLSWPNLLTIDPSNLQGGYFQLTADSSLDSVSAPLLQTTADSVTVSNNPVLPLLSLPSLISTGSAFRCSSNTILASLSLPSFVSYVSSMQVANNPALVSVLVPSLVPPDGSTLDFTGDALDAASVQQILRRCVLAGVTTCTIALQGGTNAGIASLNAQGQADVVTLGIQLTINP